MATNLKQIEADYYQNERPRVRNALREWVNGSEFKEIRRTALLERIAQVKKTYLKLRTEKPELTYWHDQLVKKLEKELRSLTVKARVHLGKATELAPERIAQAREYPISDLLPKTRGGANKPQLCPFHNDHRPSLNIKNNFYYCHACQASGDTIDLYMKLNNCSFKEAVTALTSYPYLYPDCLTFRCAKMKK